MSDLLKQVIQDLINDRTEQAEVSIHDYIVAKTQEVAGLSEAAKKEAAKKMQFPGCKVTMLQSWKGKLDKAVKELGYDIEMSGYDDASTAWSVAFHTPKKFDIKKFEDTLRDKLQMDGWLKVVPFDLVEESLNEAKGEFSTFKAWKAAAKKKQPECWIEGDEDIAQAMIGPKPYKKGETKSFGEWDGSKGEFWDV
jgi:hypothetical protein